MRFTHPIFESDFDCLTGKYRILALFLLPLLPPIIQTKKNDQKWSFLTTQYGQFCSKAHLSSKFTPLNPFKADFGRFFPKTISIYKPFLCPVFRLASYRLE